MRRNGFTMVELIFVIVIIGILAATALPKFSGVRDKAKVNSELSAMSSMDGAIIATKEFRADDFNDDNISWNDSGLKNQSAAGPAQATEYATINSTHKVLSKIAKKTENLKIVGVYLSDGNRIVDKGTTSPYKNSVLILTGPASNANTGVTPNSELTSQDKLGKPDKNDVWIFNPNNWDINITGTNPLYQNPTVIPAQSIGLVDVNGTETTSLTGLYAIRSDDTSGNTKSPQTVN